MKTHQVGGGVPYFNKGSFPPLGKYNMSGYCRTEDCRQCSYEDSKKGVDHIMYLTFCMKGAPRNGDILYPPFCGIYHFVKLVKCCVELHSLTEKSYLVLTKIRKIHPYQTSGIHLLLPWMAGSQVPHEHLAVCHPSTI